MRSTAKFGWLGFLVVGALGVAGVQMIPSETWYGNAAYDAIGFVSTVAILVGVRVFRPARPTIWYVLAAGQGTWVLGDIAYGYYAFVLHHSPFPAPADAFYLVGYAIATAALFMLIRSRTSGRDRAGLIDASIISTGLGLLCWAFVMRPIAYDDSSTVLLRMISLAYPVGDVLLLAMVARLLASPGARTASYRLIAASMVLRLFADTIYSVSVSFSDYSGLITDPAWMLSYLCCGAAALHPSMRSLSEIAPGRAARFSRGRLWMLAFSSLLAPALLVFQGMLWPPSRIDWPAIGIGAVVLFLLVLARMSGLVAQVQDQATQLEALAHNDGLTGVANRRAWDLEVVRQMAVARRTGTPLTVCLIDLDHFKLFNDQHGHQAGDRLLSQSAALWKASLRPQDFIARYGGEEFGVIMDATAAPEGRGIIERLLAVTPDGQTFSAGVATWDGAETPERLLGRADAALYAAKNAGRNRVETAPGPPPAPAGGPVLHEVGAAAP